MIQLKNCMNIFNNYVKSFDMKNKMIMSKFHHTYRVMEFTKEIAESLHLSEEDVFLAQLCGLLHDVARFRQATEYDTFIDNDSFDHGDKGYEILLENDFISSFVKDDEIKTIILLSTKYHNKKEVSNELSERQLLFANITRDADKLDILREQCNEINDNNYVIKENILSDINKHRLVKNDDVITDTDDLLRSLSFVFDINFNYSFRFLRESNIIDNKIKLLEANINNDKLNELKKIINEYINERIDNNVRNKI